MPWRPSRLGPPEGELGGEKGTRVPTFPNDLYRREDLGAKGDIDYSGAQELLQIPINTRNHYRAF